MVGFLNAASSGFDGSLMGGINAMEQYLDYVSSMSPIPLHIPLTLPPHPQFGYESTGASTVSSLPRRHVPPLTPLPPSYQGIVFMI